jgi:large subunit ribosomal protein L25
MAKTKDLSDTLTIEARTGTGTSSAHALRKLGKVPGVLYGHGTPTPITIDGRALETLLTSAAKSHVLDATIDGKHDSVLLRSVQRDPISHHPIHADFQRVSKTESVYATVPVHTAGVSPAVRDGAVMDLVTRQVEIKGPAGSIPEHIVVDVSAMGVHTHVSAHDLKLPAGFTLVTPADTVIISIETSRAAVAEATPIADAAAAAAPAAPAP